MHESDEEFGTLLVINSNQSDMNLPSNRIDPTKLEHLNADQKQAFLELLDEYADVLVEKPGLCYEGIGAAKSVAVITPIMKTPKPTQVADYRPISITPVPSRSLEKYNWIKAFFEKHFHCTRYAGECSTVAAVNASVIQGSGLGPASFIVTASDLHPKTPENRIFKFADDT